MKTQEITVLFPQPDYAVVCIDGTPVKSLSADNRPGTDKTAAREQLRRDAKAFCEGLEMGFGHAIRVLQQMTLDMRTHL